MFELPILKVYFRLKLLNDFPMTIKVSLLFFLLIISLSSFSAEVDPLFSAAIQGKTERVKSLLSDGLDVNGISSTGRTAMMGASFNGNIRIVKTLLSYGADVNIADNLGNTALMDAVFFGNEALVNLLISAGAVIDTVDKNGLSAIDKAKMTPLTKLIKALEKAQTEKTKKAENSTAEMENKDKPDDDKK